MTAADTSTPLLLLASMSSSLSLPVFSVAITVTRFIFIVGFVKSLHILSKHSIRHSLLVGKPFLGHFGLKENQQLIPKWYESFFYYPNIFYLSSGIALCTLLRLSKS
jgi:hypothetical protein